MAGQQYAVAKVNVTSTARKSAVQDLNEESIIRKDARDVYEQQADNTAVVVKYMYIENSTIHCL